MKQMTTLITGSTRGIGLGIAKRLEQDEKDVIYHGRSSGETDVKKIVLFDLNNLSSLREIYTDVFLSNNGIEHLVLNAGMGYPETFSEHTLEDIHRIFNTNLLSQIILTETHMNLCRKMNIKGKVIGISSIAANIPKPYFPLYSTSKSALSYYLKIISQRAYETGVTVNVVSPGSIKTDMTRKAIEKYANLNSINMETAEQVLYTNKNSLNRMGRIEDVANLVCFLLSNEADYINGQNFEVSGGYLYE